MMRLVDFLNIKSTFGELFKNGTSKIRVLVTVWTRFCFSGELL